MSIDWNASVDEAEWLAEAELEASEEEISEQSVCALCLQPAGFCPLLVWRTNGAGEEEEVLDHWAVCWPCVEKSGKLLQQLMTELAAARG